MRWLPPGSMTFFTGLAGFLLGALSFAVLAIIEYGTWALVVPPRTRREADGGSMGTDAGRDAAASEMRPISALAGDGMMLAGLWHPALGAEDTGRTAVLVHGFAEASLAVQAQRVACLQRAGWNVAAIDLRGYGRSGGLFASFGGREAGDLRLAGWAGANGEPIASALADRLGQVDGRGDCRAHRRRGRADPGDCPGIAHGGS